MSQYLIEGKHYSGRDFCASEETRLIRSTKQLRNHKGIFFVYFLYASKESKISRDSGPKKNPWEKENWFALKS